MTGKNDLPGQDAPELGVRQIHATREPKRTRYVVGCMSGTSLDGIDAALVSVQGSGLSMRARFVRGASCSLGNAKQTLRNLAIGNTCTASEVAHAMRDLSLAHVEVIREVLSADLRADESHELDLICVHGQTVFHAPPVSWQLMNAAPIAAAFGVPVVHDLRAMDLACGGQGAPITPLADWILFRSGSRRGLSTSGERDAESASAIINLGGFANATILTRSETLQACSETIEVTEPMNARGPVPDHGPETVLGFDICACNQILDAIARARFDAPFDDGGARALQGKVSMLTIKPLISTLSLQRAQGRSLGTGDEAIDIFLRGTKDLSTNDACATTCQVIGSVVAGAVLERMPSGDENIEIILAGGGARNVALRNAIERHAREAMRTRANASSFIHVMTTQDLGVPIEFREAVCFAVLGALCQDRVPITLASVTRVHPTARGTPPISGVWAYPP